MQSRRDVLQMGAGVAGAGLMATLAGCSSVPVVGSYFEDAPDYTEWAYDPDELDSSSLSFSLLDVESVLAEDGFPDEDRDDMRDDLSESFEDELDPEDVEYRLSIGYTGIFTGSFDASDVLEGMSISESDPYEDFDVYEDDDENGTVYFATDGDHLLRSQSIAFFDHDGREELELLIDTYNGDADRFVDASEDFDIVTDELDSGDMVSASANADGEGDDDGIVAQGYTITIDGEETNAEVVAVYEDEDDIDLDEIAEEIEEQEDADVIDIGEPSQDGRVVTVDYTVPTDELF